DRYVGLMRKYQYLRAEFFGEYGDELWDKIKNLPRGYCHCDLYDGNMLRANKDGKMYLVDFDTSCMGFPVYDITLFCNRTNYFKYDYKGYERTRIRVEKFLTGYQRYNTISDEEVSAVWHMLAVYHFQLCSQGIESDGYHADTEDNGYMSNTLAFWERQYDWLIRWKEQCMQMNSW
ncbi:MAG: phosphotransferase, partial [Oscillospiraceae bacterium]|nr:phosphotransferase [Oscillospiraceae bacterium]